MKNRKWAQPSGGKQEPSLPSLAKVKEIIGFFQRDPDRAFAVTQKMTGVRDTGELELGLFPRRDLQLVKQDGITLRSYGTPGEDRLARVLSRTWRLLGRRQKEALRSFWTNRREREPIVELYRREELELGAPYRIIDFSERCPIVEVLPKWAVWTPGAMAHIRAHGCLFTFHADLASRLPEPALRALVLHELGHALQEAEAWRSGRPFEEAGTPEREAAKEEELARAACLLHYDENAITLGGWVTETLPAAPLPVIEAVFRKCRRTYRDARARGVILVKADFLKEAREAAVRLCQHRPPCTPKG